MGFLKAPRMAPYIPPPTPPAPEPAPIKEEEADFSGIPLAPDLPQSPSEVQARTRALEKALKVKKRRTGTGGLRIPLVNTGVSLPT